MKQHVLAMYKGGGLCVARAVRHHRNKKHDELTKRDRRIADDIVSSLLKRKLRRKKQYTLKLLCWDNDSSVLAERNILDSEIRVV